MNDSDSDDVIELSTDEDGEVMVVTNMSNILPNHKEEDNNPEVTTTKPEVGTLSNNVMENKDKSNSEATTAELEVETPRDVMEDNNDVEMEFEVNGQVNGEVSNPSSPAPSGIISTPVPESEETIAIKTENETDGIEESPTTSGIGSTVNVEVPQPAKSMEKLIEVLKGLMKPNDMKQVHEKLWTPYGKLDFVTPECENSVRRAIDSCKNNILLKNTTKWKQILQLIKFMEAEAKRAKKMRANGIPITSTKHAEQTKRIEDKKQKKIAQLEKRLAKYEKVIKTYDEMEVNWDKWDDSDEEEAKKAERNSTYMIKTRLVKQHMREYETLCKVLGCKLSTGRPTQRKLKMDRLTRFPELNTAVEELLHTKGKGSLFIPDFHDVLNITRKVNVDSSLLLSSGEVEDTARSLFRDVLLLLRDRRIKDFDIALDVGDGNSGDPADNDPELEQQLEENKALRTSEADVLSKYVGRQSELKLVATEVRDDNPDDSAAESDDESETTDDEVGGGDDPAVSVPVEDPVIVISDDDEDMEDIEEIPGPSMANVPDELDTSSSSEEEEEESVEPDCKKPRRIAPTRC